MRGRKHSEESKLKMSESHKGWIPNEEWRNDKREYMLSDKNPTKGKIIPEELRKKMASYGMLGKHTTEEAKNKISLSKIGKPRSEDTKEKLRQIKSDKHWAFGKNFSKEEIEKMSLNMYGLKHGENTSSKYIGVSFIKKNKKWKAGFSFNKKYIYVGLFENEIEAALAYNEFALDCYGYKAKLNIISQEQIDDLWKYNGEVSE